MSRLKRLWNAIPVPVEHAVGIGAGLMLGGIRPALLPRVLRRSGRLLVVLGLVVNMKAIMERGAGDLEHPGRLVIKGLHGVTRNPMYLGWSAIHIGLGLRFFWVLATWPASFALIHRAVLAEEQQLTLLFGQQYLAYLERVPRYFPRLRRPP